jgi:imidazolonepropionase-like amidohydrolase
MTNPSARFRQLCAVTAACLMIAIPSVAQQEPPKTTVVIRAGKLFDPASGRMLESPVVVVSGNRIEAVGSRELAVPAGARLIDLGDVTLLPGFIDVHTHLTSNAGGGGYESLEFQPHERL